MTWVMLPFAIAVSACLERKGVNLGVFGKNADVGVLRDESLRRSCFGCLSASVVGDQRPQACCIDGNEGGFRTGVPTF
jgi:hypothetical protein